MSYIKKRSYLLTIVLMSLLAIGVFASVKIAGNSTGTLVEVDTTSKAMRATLYDSKGSEIFPEQHLATYSAFASAGFTPGTQDAFTITGSATKTVKVYRMVLSNIQTTAGINQWTIMKRNTANSGGTSSSVTIVAHDSNDSAATCTVLSYTANPTAGNQVGLVWSGYVNSPAAATAGVGGFEGVQVDFTRLYGKPITLRGTGDVLTWNFNGNAVPSGLSVIAGATFSEE